MRTHCHTQACNRRVGSGEWFCPTHRPPRPGDAARTVRVQLVLPLDVARAVGTIARRTHETQDVVVARMLKDSLGME